MDGYESIWNGRESLTETLDRDYAAMWGDDWDLIWVPTSPLTTPWENASPFARPDPEAFVKTEMARRTRRTRRQPTMAKDWTGIYNGQIGRVVHHKGWGR